MSERPLRLLGIGDGRSIIFLRWAWRLAERGHEVHIVSNRITDRPGELDLIHGHNIRELGGLMRLKGARRLGFGPALRRFAQSTKSGLDLGAMESITYYGPGVAIDLQPSALVWNSEIYMAEWDSIHRMGTSDITFTLPGSSPDNPKFFHEIAGKAGYEIRGYWRQFIVPKRPACLTQVTGIVNSV